MQTIVESKKKINPYRAGQIALVTAGYLAVLGLTALFILLSATAATDDGVFGWGVAAFFGSVASILITCFIGSAVYADLEKKSKSWRPYSE